MISYPATAAGVTTRIIEHGSGDTTLVLVHGVGARADRWVRFLQHLPPHVRGLAFDLPGHGFATKGPGPEYSVSGYSAFLAELLHVLGLDRPVAIGTSLGAHVVAAAEVQQPGTFDSLVLVGATGIVPIGATARLAIADRLGDTSREGIAAKLRSVLADEHLVTDEWIEEEFQINNSEGAAASFRALADYFARQIDEDVVGPDLRDLIEGRGTRVHLIWGAQDRAVPVEIGEAASRELGGLPLTQIPDTGHAPYFEDPRTFTKRLGEALEWPNHGDTGPRGAVEMRRQEIEVEGLNEPISHYVDAVRFGDLLFVSGCAPVDSATRLVGEDDVVLQCRQVFENLKECLAAAGLTFANVLRVTVYLTDIDDRAAINPVRQEFFGTARPASTLIEVSKLAIPGMKVEIEAIAGIEQT